jgi:hypothetical protein
MIMRRIHTKRGFYCSSAVAWLLLWLSIAQVFTPEFRFIFHIKPGDLESLRSVVAHFAESESLSVFDNGAILPPKPPDGRRLFFLILKTQDEDIQVTVSNVREEDEILVAVFGSIRGQKPNPIASKLEQMLRAKWPDIQPYTGP